MGGCFAQAESTAAVDTYWPAEKVAVPSYPTSSSLSLYEHDVVPAGVHLDDCHVYTRQVVNAGAASFFFVFQNSPVFYNGFMTDNGDIVLGIQSFFNNFVNAGFAPNYSAAQAYPWEVILSADSTGIRTAGKEVVQLGPCDWDSTQPGARLRILDARKGEKDFYVAHGAWGWKWYLLPMRSPIGSVEAVFDFEEKVLVEL